MTVRLFVHGSPIQGPGSPVSALILACIFSSFSPPPQYIEKGHPNLATEPCK